MEEDKKLEKKEVAKSGKNDDMNVVGNEDEEYQMNYGDITLVESQSTTDLSAGYWRKTVDGKTKVQVSDLFEDKEGSLVLLTGRVHKVQGSKKLVFLTLREKGSSVQCVGRACEENKIGSGMLKFIRGISRESFVEVLGLVCIPKEPINFTTQQTVEISIRKLFCISKALQVPFSVEDASRPTDVSANAKASHGPRVTQETRWIHRVIDLRTPANQAIFRIRTHTENVFREFLLAKDFDSIQTPKLLQGVSDGGAAVFTLDYKGKPASLAQSAQLHKQMAISSGFTRVFDIGTYFRAETSHTNRHLREFVVLNVEMELHYTYKEIMDLVDELFVSLFTRLNELCKKQLEAVGQQYPFEPLKFLPNTPRLTFEQGVQMLKESGQEVDPLGDLNTENERKLGKLVFEKYKTDFYMLHRYPLAARPFFTMPCADDSRYSNSFDAFMRGEEIISGAQRIHDQAFLKTRALDCGIKLETIEPYINSFKYGTPLHGGFGAGLDRVVMLFCGLDNIRKASLFPRDHRLAP